MINRSAENEADRRKFLRSAGLTGLGVVGATALSGGVASAMAGTASASPAAAAQATEDAKGLTDASVLNFALCLEYLEAQFYLHAVTGKGLPDAMTTGTGSHGGVTGGAKVPFKTPQIRQLATEIAQDERAHVAFLRTALSKSAVAQPAIDLQHSFTAAAQAAGVIKPGQVFNPFADENSFLLGAFLFEDVGVTAYKGASPLITNKTYLEAAAGILAVEAYHASGVRAALTLVDYGKQRSTVTKLSAARDSLDGKTDDDQGILNKDGSLNLVPTDSNGLAYSRQAPNVLNIVYLTPKAAKGGGFFPKGVNGDITMSANNT